MVLAAEGLVNALTLKSPERKLKTPPYRRVAALVRIAARTNRRSIGPHTG